MTNVDIKKFQEAADNGTIKDDANPIFIFHLTDSLLLAKILSGKIDAKKLASIELENRGLDKNGNWVGFKTKK